MSHESIMERSALTISLYVPHVSASIEFYTSMLGFSLVGSWDEDGRPVWAEVALATRKGTARIWFFCHPIEGRPSPGMSGIIYVFVDDVLEQAERIDPSVKVQWGP